VTYTWNIQVEYGGIRFVHNRSWKAARTGYPVEKEPPVNTPKWALSDEWKERLRRREEEMVQVEEAER